MQTSFDFDVYNNENIVGKANADAQTRVITTTFNNYFTEHPLNKKMSLKFDAKWLDVVEPGKPVTVNFDGTVKTFEIADRDHFQQTSFFLSGAVKIKITHKSLTGHYVLTRLVKSFELCKIARHLVK